MRVFNRGKSYSAHISGRILKQETKIIYPVSLTRLSDGMTTNGYVVIKHPHISETKTLDESTRLKSIITILEGVLEGAVIASSNAKTTSKYSELALDITALNNLADSMAKRNETGQISVSLEWTI